MNNNLINFKPDIGNKTSSNLIQYKILETISPFYYYDQNKIKDYTGLSPDSTHAAFIEATNNCKRKFRVISMYAELTRTYNFNDPNFKNIAGKEWFNAIINALKRGIEVEYIILDPPLFDPWNSDSELGILKKYPNFTLLNLQWNYFYSQNDNDNNGAISGWAGNGWLWKDFPLSVLYNFGLAGVIHSKVYIWDNDTVYIGSQTFGHPFAPEMGLLFKSSNVTIQAEKYYEFLKYCSILQQGGYSLNVDDIYTGMFPMPIELKYDININKPLKGRFRNINTGGVGKEYSNTEFAGSIITGISPIIQAKLQGATPGLDIFNDIFNNAEKSLDLCVMSIGGYVGWAPFTVKWDNFADLFENAIKRGVRVRVLFAIYGEIGSDFSQDQYFALTFFQKLKLKYNCGKYKGSIDAKFIRAGLTPQKFDEEGEMYCYCQNNPMLTIKTQTKMKMDEIFQKKPLYNNLNPISSKVLFGYEKEKISQVPDPAGAGFAPRITPPIPTWAALTPEYEEISIKSLEYCTTPGQNPNIPGTDQPWLPGILYRPKVCPMGRDGNIVKDPFYSMMYHKKMIITEKAVYITSANFTLDYFLVTGDFSCYIKSDNPDYFPLRDCLENSYQNDWLTRAQPIDELSCEAAKQGDEKYNNPIKDPAGTDLLYIKSSDICGKMSRCKIDFDKVICVDGYDNKTNRCKPTKEKLTSGELTGIIIGSVIAVIILIYLIIFLVKI